MNYNVVFRKYTRVNKHHRYPRKTNMMYSANGLRLYSLGLTLLFNYLVQ